MITYAIGHDVLAPPKNIEELSQRESDHREFVRIVAEIAERLDEAEVLMKGKAAALMGRLVLLHRQSPQAYRWTLQCMHGDTSQITEAFATRAKAHGKTKQDMAYQQDLAFDTAATYFPEVADVLASIRAQVGKHEDGASKADLLRDS